MFDKPVILNSEFEIFVQKAFDILPDIELKDPSWGVLRDYKITKCYDMSGDKVA